jgi:hypothetical protein
MPVRPRVEIVEIRPSGILEIRADGMLEIVEVAAQGPPGIPGSAGGGGLSDAAVSALIARRIETHNLSPAAHAVALGEADTDYALILRTAIL